jgi:hypothetical protein
VILRGEPDLILSTTVGEAITKKLRAGQPGSTASFGFISDFSVRENQEGLHLRHGRDLLTLGRLGTRQECGFLSFRRLWMMTQVAFWLYLEQLFWLLFQLQTWSETFRRSESKAVLLIWSLLLFIRMISALLYQAFNAKSGFTQLRFCPLNYSDTLPLLNSGLNQGGVWDQTDQYYWNRTITHYFQNLTTGNLSTCIYPCFDTSFPLRDLDRFYASAHLD